MKAIEGRATRSEFVKVNTLVTLATVVTFAVVISATLLVGLPEVVAIILMGICVILGNYISITTGIRRLHDFGKSGWWYLTVLIPIANIVLLLALLFTPSSDGDNAYGKQKT